MIVNNPLCYCDLCVLERQIEEAFPCMNLVQQGIIDELLTRLVAAEDELDAIADELDKEKNGTGENDDDELE